MSCRGIDLGSWESNPVDRPNRHFIVHQNSILPVAAVNFEIPSRNLLAPCSTDVFTHTKPRRWKLLVSTDTLYPLFSTFISLLRYSLVDWIPFFTALSSTDSSFLRLPIGRFRGQFSGRRIQFRTRTLCLAITQDLHCCFINEESSLLFLGNQRKDRWKDMNRSGLHIWTNRKKGIGQTRCTRLTLDIKNDEKILRVVRDLFFKLYTIPFWIVNACEYAIQPTSAYPCIWLAHWVTYHNVARQIRTGWLYLSKKGWKCTCAAISSLKLDCLWLANELQSPFQSFRDCDNQLHKWKNSVTS